jgi:uncharacterized protein (TIGR03435 family)
MYSRWSQSNQVHRAALADVEAQAHAVVGSLRLNRLGLLPLRLFICLYRGHTGKTVSALRRMILFPVGRPGLNRTCIRCQAVVPQAAPTCTRQQFRDGSAPKLQLMIRNLLTDRLELAVHRESREMSIYALTVAKNGPKLKAFEDGSCDPAPPLPSPQQIPPGQKRPCSFGVGIVPDKNGGFRKIRVVANGVSLEKLSQALNLALDRPVIDRTGISGVFDFNLDRRLREHGSCSFQSLTAINLRGLLNPLSRSSAQYRTNSALDWKPQKGQSRYS